MRISFWVKDRFRWVFWFPFRRILTWLPLSISYQLGVLLGLSYHLVARERRVQTFRELRTLSFARELDKKDLAFIVRWATINLVLNHIDILLYPKLAQTPIAEYTEIQGRYHLDAALAQNRGVILVHTHFGNPQLLISALGWRNYPINQLGRAPQDIYREDEKTRDEGMIASLGREDASRMLSGRPFVLSSFGSIRPSPMLERVLNLIHELEQSLPAKFIYTQKTLLPAIRALKKNELVAIAIDGLAGKNRVEVTVHGRQVSFSTGAVAIAKRTGAVVLPVFVLRRKSAYQHKVIIDPPLELFDTGDEMADLKIYTQKIADRFAELLAMYPCQYARLFGYKRPYFIKNS